MDFRSPLKDLTTDNIAMNENNETQTNIDKFNLLSKPRMSLIKAFDPLYESPLRCITTQITSDGGSMQNALNCFDIGHFKTPSDGSLNDENCDPISNQLLNISNTLQEDFINDIREFAQGIIMEAINTVFPNDSFTLNDTFYETADPLILESTCNTCNSSETVVRSTNSTNENTDKSVRFCNHEEELNELKSHINELLKQNLVTQEELTNTKDELTKVKIDCENKNEMLSTLQQKVLNERLGHEKQLQSIEETCKNNENVVTQEELTITKSELAQVRIDWENKNEMLIRLQQEILNERMEHEKQLQSVKQTCKENSETEKDVDELQKLCKEKDSFALQLQSEVASKEREFAMEMDMFDQLTQKQLEEIKTLKNEHDIATRHLSNLEIAFADVHQKYERSKLIIDGYKKNEENYRSTLEIFKENLTKYDEKVEAIKKRAIEEINRLRTEIYDAHEERTAETSKLVNRIKRLEIKNSSLTSALDQKTIECHELAKLCDEVNGPTEFYQ